MKKKKKFRLIKALYQVALVLLANFFLLLIILQFSAVQTSLGRMLASDVAKKTGFVIKIGKLDIQWLDQLTLKDIAILDLSKNEMITIDNLLVDYRVSSLLSNQRIVIDKAKIDNANINLIRSDSLSLNITEFIEKIRQTYASEKNGNAKPFIISNAEIRHGKFSYNHKDKLYLENLFDYNHFTFDSINATTQNLIIVADTFDLDIKKLSAIEQITQLPIRSLKANYHINKSQMRLDQLKAAIGSSTIGDTLVFNYQSISDLNDFIEKVEIVGKLKEIKLATQDLKYFTSYFNSINDTIFCTGVVDGYISDFKSRNLSLAFGKGSNLQGNVYFEGLPDIPNTFMDLKFNHSKLKKEDLSPYIKSESFDKYAPIDSAMVNGTFTGYTQDFVTYGSFNTSLGIIRTDLNLKLGNDPSNIKYSGKLKLEEFDIGKAINKESLLGKATLDSEVNGSGVGVSDADFNLKGKAQKIRVRDYTYRNIETNAHFAFGLFEGTLNINDPYLQVETKGHVDLRNNKNQIQLTSNFKKARLDSLKLRTDPSAISGKMMIDVKGIALDSIVGKVEVSDLYAFNNEQELYVKDINIESIRNGNERILKFESDRVDLEVSGDFHFTSAYKDIRNLWQEYKFNLLNQESDIESFYARIENEPASSNFKFDLKLYNINPLLNLFVPNAHFSDDTKIVGEMKSGNTTEFIINLNNDSIFYDNTLLLKNSFSLSAKTNVLKRGVNAKVNFNSLKQILGSGSMLENFNLVADWQKDTLDFKVHLEQENETNVNNINGRFTFGVDTTYLNILPSTLQVLEEVWNVEENNEIVFTKNKVDLYNVRLFNRNQELTAQGSLSKTSNDPIQVSAKNVNIAVFNPLLPNQLSGRLDGTVNISNIYDSPLIESDLRINNFTVDGFLFGNIEGTSNWNNKKRAFDVGFSIEKEGKRLVRVTGTHKPLGDTNALNLKAQLLGTDLQIAEPFTKGLFSGINGAVSGTVSITGPLFAPELSGSGSIDNASLTIDYLKTAYNFNGKWSIGKNFINLVDINLTDGGIGKGKLNTKFEHKNFTNFTMDLGASFTSLITLNTEPKDNTLFYGTTIGSGDLSIIGPIDNLTITARAKTEKGTRFFIPLTDSGSSIQQEDFVTFHSFTKKGTLDEKSEEDKNTVNLSGIVFNLDVEITPDAYAEIIFDRTAGDIIRGRGTGNLSLAIDTKGEFTVIGEYEFTEGAYNFTMYNIVNKEFTINPKSKITWSGDPYLGELDINAIYKVNTTIAPLMGTDSTYQKMPEVNRIYPSFVLLDLDGPLTSPDIDFDIIIEDYPKTNADIDTQVRAFLNKIHNDEQEMNRQVFSLLVLRKYSSPNSFEAGSTLGSSVSEFVSNQLSYWISQVDENLTIDIDLGSLDAEALQTFQLRVSYAFLDGKLIVTRDGGFTDQNQQATLSSVTGDWTVEYLLSQDGKLRVKLFKKTNYDQLSSSTSSDQDLITGGFSLLYTTSFDSVKELFTKKKNKGSDQSPSPDQPRDALKPEDNINTP